MAWQYDFPTKEEKYPELLKKLDTLFNPKLTRGANISQVLAQVKKELALFWIGIYVLDEENKLKIDVFQGDPACTEIEMGQGACGVAAQKQEIVNIKDVNEVDNYIACHEETMSEIVIPGISNNQTLFVLDIDSEKPAYFEEIDEKYLKQVADHLVKIFEHYGGN